MLKNSLFLFWNIWLVSDVTWFDSLQTAVTASTENRKQAQEQNQEQQRNLINLQHDLSQVGAKLGDSTCSEMIIGKVTIIKLREHNFQMINMENFK